MDQRRPASRCSDNMNCFNRLFTCFFLMHTSGITGLKDIHIKVPEAVRVGDTVTLTCDYDLEQAALYTIKWYHYEEEFYRYVPKESPPSKVFPMPHLNIDMHRSNSKEVTLKDVQRETSGEFKCEVSADAPLFHTEIRTAPLLVADVPNEGPVIRSEVYKKSHGANVLANCTTPGSHPRMNVTWFINDSQNFSRHKVEVTESVNRYEALPGLLSVRSTITFKLSQEFIRNGKIKLRCLATMFDLYRRAKEEEIQEDAQLQPLIMPTPRANEDINRDYQQSSSSASTLIVRDGLLKPMIVLCCLLSKLLNI